MQPIRFAPLVLALLCWSPQPTAAQEDLSFEPYSVFVIEAKAHARCGPSDEYYRTDPLRRGQALDVYAETDDGWLGIRPPEGSFCWVQAEMIDLDAATDTGVVIEDRTVAWIGTHLGRARSYRWQVQMAAGEEVTVIGKSEREGPDGPQLWYRIVPPSGEYRWVHRDQVVDSSEQLVELTERATQQSLQAATRQRTAASDDRSSAPIDPNRSTPDRGDPVLDQVATDAIDRSVLAETGPGREASWQTNDNRLAVDQAVADADLHSTVSEPTSATVNATFIGRPKLLEIGSTPAAPNRNLAAGDSNWVTGTSPRRAVAVATTGLASPVAQASGQQPLPAQPLTPGAVPALKPLTFIPAERIAQIEAEVGEADIERLDLIFSRLMAAQATAAEMEPVARAARGLATLPDAGIAGRARMLAERAEQYRRIANQRDGRAVIGQAGGIEIPSVQPTQPASIPLTATDQPANAETYHTGTLVQVYSARSNSPPFALIDNTGRTIAYVTPTPGTNLRIHLNSKIRISGTPGYLTGLNTPHLVAASATRVVE